jgi:tetratricopeptide (TPR) repeat protein
LLAGRIKTRLTRENLSLQEQALLQLSLGTELQNLGEYSEAFTIYLQALEKYRQLNNKRFIALTLNSLGHICSSISLVSLEEYYYSEAIENITPEFNEYISLKANLFRIKANEDESAIDSMFYLIEIAEKENREELLPAFYLNIGSYFFYNDPEKAFQYFTKVQTLDFDSPKILATLYANMAAFYCYQKDISKGLLYFKDAQKIIEENNNFFDLAIIYNNISILYEMQNMPDSALFYVRKNQQVTEKLRSNTVAIETHQKTVTSTLEASKNQLIIAEQQITLKNRQFAIIVIVSVSAILLILLLLLFVHQQKRRKASENRELTAKLEYEKLEKEKQEEIIDAKTRELASFSILVSNKNQLLKQISEQIEQMYNDKENAIQIATKTDKIIRSNLNIDEEWANFKMHFDKVHPYFF